MTATYSLPHLLKQTMPDIMTNFGGVTFTNGKLRLEKRRRVFFIRLVQTKSKVVILFVGVLFALALMYFQVNGFTIRTILSFGATIGKVVIFSVVVGVLLGTILGLAPPDRNVISWPNKCEIPIDSISSVTTEKEGLIHKIYITHEISKEDDYTVSHVLEFIPGLESEQKRAIKFFKDKDIIVRQV